MAKQQQLLAFSTPRTFQIQLVKDDSKVHFNVD